MEERSDSPSTRIPERRMYPRYAVDDRATLFLLNHGASVASQVIELSLSGCRLRVPLELRVRALTRVEVTFKVNGIAFRLSGITQWTDSRQILGVCFAEMSSRRRDELSELMAEIKAETEAKAAKVEADQLAAQELAAEKQVADDLVSEAGSARPTEQAKLVSAPPTQAKPVWENSPAERLAEATRTEQKLAEQKLAQQDSQRKLTEQAAATRARTQTPLSVLPAALHRPLPPIFPVAPVTGGLKGPESEKLELPPRPIRHNAPPNGNRRAQSRHSVDSTASIFLVDVASKAAGRIIDVSLGGCRIRTDERFPVGIYRRVEVEFVLDGLQFRLGGVTQSLHDKCMVGVRFLNLSDRKREQLLMLVEEIDQMNSERSQKTSEVGSAPL